MPPKPETQEPAAKQAKVYLSTPNGELAVDVEVVNTWPKIEKGLMYREHLGTDAGMLFMMGFEHDHAFYMRNTLIPLDMIFIRPDGTIARIAADTVPLSETPVAVAEPPPVIAVEKLRRPPPPTRTVKVLTHLFRCGLLSTLTREQQPGNGATTDDA